MHCGDACEGLGLVLAHPQQLGGREPGQYAIAWAGQKMRKSQVIVDGSGEACAASDPEQARSGPANRAVACARPSANSVRIFASDSPDMPDTTSALSPPSAAAAAAGARPRTRAAALASPAPCIGWGLRKNLAFCL